MHLYLSIQTAHDIHALLISQLEELFCIFIPKRNPRILLSFRFLFFLFKQTLEVRGMASSKVMSSTSPANPDLPRQSSIHPLAVSDLQSDRTKSFGSMNMDDLLKNIYADPEPFPADTSEKKTFDEVWKETVTGASAGPGGSHREPGMTLEDFLEKAGAVREDDVRMTEVDSIVNASQFPMQPSQNGPTGYEMVSVAAVSGVGGGRGKRRVVEEPPVDKATQQKQRRMIKNRESAARSRERKQAYTVELESLVTQFEEENARLVREEAEEKKERLNQLMKNIIPVVEERRPPRSLRRTNSM